MIFLQFSDRNQFEYKYAASKALRKKYSYLFGTDVNPGEYKNPT